MALNGLIAAGFVVFSLAKLMTGDWLKASGARALAFVLIGVAIIIYTKSNQIARPVAVAPINTPRQQYKKHLTYNAIFFLTTT